MDEFDKKQNVELSTRDMINIIQALPVSIRKIEYEIIMINLDIESYDKKIAEPIEEDGRTIGWGPDQIKSFKESKSKLEKKKNKLEREIDSMKKLGTRLENELDID